MFVLYFVSNVLIIFKLDPNGMSMNSVEYRVLVFAFMTNFKPTIEAIFKGAFALYRFIFLI